jgi:hypothetical protein
MEHGPRSRTAAVARLVGLISLNDIAREAVRERTRKNPDVTPEEVGTTLAAIGHPRLAKHLPATA